MTATGAALAASAWLAVASPASGAEVEVELKLETPDALIVSYTLPAQCRALAFLKNGEAGRDTRAAWQPLDDCGTAGAEQLSRVAGSCAVLRFRVPAATRQTGYPAAFPMGRGLYAHMSNYALAGTCGKVAYRLAAPGIGANGRAYEGDAEALAGADTAALLMAAPLESNGAAPPAYFDPRLPPAAVAHIKTVADGTVDYLRRAMPDARFTRPIVAAVAAAEPGGPNIGGDAGDVLRLSLFNWPRDPAPAVQAKLTLLVSHEFSHRFQLRDAVDGYPDARLIHEGGAEFLRWMASFEQGWLTPAQAVEQLDSALARCVLYTDQKNWRGLTPRAIGADRLEYQCGLPAYVYALAARQGRGTAMSRVNGFYRDLAAGATPDFYGALECGADGTAAAPCHARWLPLLLGGEGTMDQQWQAMLAASGLATLQPPTQAERDIMVLRALVKLMRNDCGGRSGTTETPDSVILDGMTACKTFVRDADVTAIEGLPVFGNAGTGEALAAACAARASVLLGLRDGGTLSAPCGEPYRMRQQFYRADIGKLLAALRRE